MTELKKVFITVPKDQRPERLDLFLTRQLENATRHKIQIAIGEGRVLVDDKEKKSSYKVRGDDKIEIIFTRPPSPEITAENIPLDILFEDEFLLAINKPPGMVVHPAFGNWTGTVANAVLHHTKESFSTKKTLTFRPGIVHRLDKNTSGVMVIAKDEDTGTALSKLFAQRKTKKYYFAICLGNFKKNARKIETKIGRSHRDRKTMTCYSLDASTGKYALTEYEVLESLNGFSFLKLRLHTGRTHQLRVHLAHEGHPILGDETYGGRPSNIAIPLANSKAFIKNLLEVINRQALHAGLLEFRHPQTGKHLTFEAPIPSDIDLALKKIRQTQKL